MLLYLTVSTLALLLKHGLHSVLTRSLPSDSLQPAPSTRLPRPRPPCHQHLAPSQKALRCAASISCLGLAACLRMTVANARPPASSYASRALRKRCASSSPADGACSTANWRSVQPVWSRACSRGPGGGAHTHRQGAAHQGRAPACLNAMHPAPYLSLPFAGHGWSARSMPQQRWDSRPWAPEQAQHTLAPASMPSSAARTPYSSLAAAPGLLHRSAWAARASKGTPRRLNVG
jgi:hypothetical protein